MRLSLTYVFIILNALVFFMWKTKSPIYMEQNFAVSWTLLQEGHWWVLLTSVFSHSWSVHFLVNMIVLRDFGGMIEEVFGKVFYLWFYLLAGVVGSLCHALVSAFVLHNPDLPAVGASGAICGLVLLFALVFPRRKLLIFWLIPLPAIFGGLLLIGLDLWGVYAQAGGGGLPIGHGAHLGGALTGLVVYFVYIRGLVKKMRKSGPSLDDDET
jgi:membrane associated rhomboid family serine protease